MVKGIKLILRVAAFVFTIGGCTGSVKYGADNRYEDNDTMHTVDVDKEIENQNPESVKNALKKFHKNFYKTLPENLRRDYPKNNTLLHKAVTYWYLQAVKHLVEQGDNIEAKNANGETPLHIAIWSKLTERMLITKPELKDEQDKICVYLIKKGANVKEIDNLKEAPIHKAVKSNKSKIAELLINKDNTIIDQQNQSGDTPLHIATELGFTEIVGLLLKHHANIKVTNKEGKTPFLEITNKEGETPLQRATELGFAEIVGLLLKYGADIKVKNKAGKPLWDTIIEKMFKMATSSCLPLFKRTFELLIEHDSTILIETNEQGNTFFHQLNGYNNAYNSSNQNTDMSKIFKFIYGIVLKNKDNLKDNINIPNRNHQTALDIANKSGNENIINFLQKFNAKSSSELALLTFQQSNLKDINDLD